MAGTVERFQERDPRVDVLHDAEALFAGGAAEAAARTSAVARGAVCAVCGRLAALRCSKCRAARYCGAGCQRQHWRDGHRAACALEAAAAGGDE